MIHRTRPVGTVELYDLTHRVVMLPNGYTCTACRSYVELKQMHNKEHVVTCLWCIADCEV